MSMPIQGLCLDWETRSRTDIKTDPHYDKHPTTEPLLLAWKFRHASGVWDIARHEPIPDALLEALEDVSADVLSFSDFDRRIYDRFHEALGLPEIHPDRWVDVQAVCRANGLAGNLDTAGKTLGLGNKQEDGKDLIKKFCILKKPTKKKPGHFIEPDADPEAWDRFKSYALQDVVLMAKIVQRIGYLNAFETRVAEVTRAMNLRGIPFDHGFCQKIGARFKLLKEKVAADIETTTGGIKGNSHDAFRQWFNGRFGTALESMTEAAELLERKQLPQEAIDILTAREIVAASSGAKTDAILNAGLPDPMDENLIWIQNSFVYCGASATARFAGRGIQPQNFPRPEKAHDEKVIDAYLGGALQEDRPVPGTLEETLAEINLIRSCLRALIRHPEGVCWVDYSGVELRTLAVVTDAYIKAGIDEDSGAIASLSAKIRKGIDLYIDMGMKIAAALGIEGVTVENCAALGWRQLGKTAVLGLNYQQGAKRFMMTNQIDGRDMTFAEAEIIVKAYRDAYPAVRALWRWLPNAFIRTLKTGRTIGLKGVFCYERIDATTLRMVKPSGSSLIYRGICLEQEKDKYNRTREKIVLETLSAKTGKPQKSAIHGGQLLEHVCSSLARDLLVHSMVKAEDAGIRVISSVHDELVAIGGEPEAMKLKGIMLDLPDWAEGWPIGAEAAWGGSWGK